MATAIQSGPCVVTGNTNPSQNFEPGQGPSLNFQGAGILDPRYVASIGSAPGNKIFGLYAPPYVTLMDAQPVTLGPAKIVASANPAGPALALVTAQAAGIAPLIPIIPFGQALIASNIVNVLALDFGFTAGNTASSTTLTIPAGAWKYFYKGQRLCIAGANGVGAAPLFATVVVAPVPNGTTLTIDTAATTSTNNCAVGTAHPTLNIAWPNVIAGDIALFDTTQATARAISYTAAAAATYTTATAVGYDVYNQRMTEQVTLSAGSTVNGKKAFKYVQSITLSGGSADTTHAYSIGTLDILGFSVRSDFWEYMNLFVAGTFISTNTGYVVPDATSPATSTTGDVRGTYALQTASNWDGTTANWGTARKSAFFASIPVYNMVGANNLNYATLFGTTQA